MVIHGILPETMVEDSRERETDAGVETESDGNAQPDAGKWIGSEEPPLKPVSIWDYTDYRSYLRDSFAAAKAVGNPVSNRWLARRLGFKSFSFITMLLQGKRNLTRPNRMKFSRLLGLDADAEAYFAALVEYNQAREDLDRERALQSMVRLRKAGSRGAFLCLDLNLSEEGMRLLRDLVDEFRVRAEALAGGPVGGGREPAGPILAAAEYRLEVRLFPV